MGGEDCGGGEEMGSVLEGGRSAMDAWRGRGEGRGTGGRGWTERKGKRHTA